MGLGASVEEREGNGHGWADPQALSGERVSKPSCPLTVSLGSSQESWQHNNAVVRRSVVSLNPTLNYKP